MHRQKGFSLIELLVVVAIILVLAAMAIPNLMSSKVRANEASAVNSLRTISTAQGTYIVTYPQEGYADNLSKLGAPASGDPVDENHSALLDWVLGCASQPCHKSGYMFEITNVVGDPVSAYEVTGVPSVPGTTGKRGFCLTQMTRVLADENGGTGCTQIVE